MALTMLDVALSHEVRFAKIIHRVDDLLICVHEGLHGNFECVLQCSCDVLLGDDALVQEVLHYLQGVKSIAAPGVVFWYICQHLEEPVCLQGGDEIIGLWIVEIHEVG